MKLKLVEIGEKLFLIEEKNIFTVRLDPLNIKDCEEIVKRVNLHEELINAVKNFVESVDIICEGLEDGQRRNVYLSIQQSLTYSTAKSLLEKV